MLSGRIQKAAHSLYKIKDVLIVVAQQLATIIFSCHRLTDRIQRRKKSHHELLCGHLQTSLTDISIISSTPPIWCTPITKQALPKPRPSLSYEQNAARLLLVPCCCHPAACSSSSDPETCTAAAASCKHTECLFTSKPVVYSEALPRLCNVTILTL